MLLAEAAAVSEDKRKHNQEYHLYQASYRQQFDEVPTFLALSLGEVLNYIRCPFYSSRLRKYLNLNSKFDKS